MFGAQSTYLRCAKYGKGSQKCIETTSKEVTKGLKVLKGKKGMKGLPAFK
jgi:hypothetical protein